MNLQEIRAYQALHEIGDFKSVVSIVHAEMPKTIIKGKEYTLVFPKEIMSFNRDKKLDRIFFSGVITRKRKRFLKRLLKSYSISMCLINSLNGRDKEKRDMDSDYFYALANSNYVACPDGDFFWSYRFFEAVLCKAIPIIQSDSPLYDGYKFYRLGDKLEYREDWVEHNLLKVKKEMML